MQASTPDIYKNRSGSCKLIKHLNSTVYFSRGVGSIFGQKYFDSK